MGSTVCPSGVLRTHLQTLAAAGVHVTFITPYEDHTPGSPQYKWCGLLQPHQLVCITSHRQQATLRPVAEACTCTQSWKELRLSCRTNSNYLVRLGDAS